VKSSDVTTASIDGVFEDDPVDVFSAIGYCLSSFVEIISVLFFEEFLKVFDFCWFEYLEPVYKFVVVLAVGNLFDQN
jgi:hypothetical protein